MCLANEPVKRKINANMNRKKNRARRGDDHSSSAYVKIAAQLLSWPAMDAPSVDPACLMDEPDGLGLIQLPTAE